MSRREFTAETKRQAWKRGMGRCEASGTIYGLNATVVCGRDLTHGVEYDHVDPDANSKDNSLENCCAVCPKCHAWKTRFRDRPLIAKTNHQQDKARGIEKPFKQHMPGSRKTKFKRKMNGEVVLR